MVGCAVADVPSVLAVLPQRMQDTHRQPSWAEKGLNQHSIQGARLFL